MEIWEIIKNYENYEISNFGNVKSKKTGKILKKELSNSGYFRVMLYGGKRKGCKISVHRLVAINFIKNDKNKKTVNHINGIKTDNRIENLEWNTHSENQNHAIKTGLQKHLVGSKRGMNVCKLDELIVSEIKQLLKLGISQVTISDMYNINQSNISRIKNKKQWAHV